MVANRGHDTEPEREIRSALHRSGLRFRKHSRPVSALRCEADILFPREQIAVFIDGCFWHHCPRHGQIPKANEGWWRDKFHATTQRDRRNDRILSEHGWEVIRIWEHESVSDAKKKIQEAVKRRRTVPIPH
jgi:DNA mismatch endonuclease (patch repair protein)